MYGSVSHFGNSPNISIFIIIICYGDLWLAIFDATIAKRFWLKEDLDDG